MARKKHFSDDGWAVWVTGEDTSTFYLNEWINPRGHSYVDVAIRIFGIKETSDLNIFIPFFIEKHEVEDLSFYLKDETIFRSLFSTRCVFDYMKNEFTSEMAYHGKTVDLVHFSKLGFKVSALASGSLLSVSIDSLKQYLDNDEAYFVFRLPHKNLDAVFQSGIDVHNMFKRFRDLITSPVVSEKYVCSVRVNEARLLPDEINKIGAFYRQKLNKSVVTISLHENYQVNDANCYRIHRLEPELYGEYAPEGFCCEDAITYEWNESRVKNLYGHFNFYFAVSREYVSKISMLIYVLLLFIVGVGGNLLWEILCILFGT